MLVSEAMKEAIDGKKIRRTEWDPGRFLWFDLVDGRFVNEDGFGRQFLQEEMSDDWEVIEELVSFEVAFDAFYNDSIVIRSVVSNVIYCYQTVNDLDLLFSVKEIAGDWVIM